VHARVHGGLPWVLAVGACCGCSKDFKQSVGDFVMSVFVPGSLQVRACACAWGPAGVLGWEFGAWSWVLAVGRLTVLGVAVLGCCGGNLQARMCACLLGWGLIGSAGASPLCPGGHAEQEEGAACCIHAAQASVSGRGMQHVRELQRAVPQPP